MRAFPTSFAILALMPCSGLQSLCAQTYDSVTVRRAIVLNGSNECSRSTRPVGAPTAADSIVIYFISDDGTTATPNAVPLTLRLNRIVVEQLTAEADTLLSHHTGVDLTATKEYELVSVDGRLLCNVTIKHQASSTWVNATVDALVLQDSTSLDSVRSRVGLRGNSYVILSLIKSIAGEIPDDEFFDIRLKLGGDFGDRGTSASRRLTADSLVVRAARVAAEYRTLTAEADTGSDTVAAQRARKRADKARREAEDLLGDAEDARQGKAPFFLPARLFTLANLDVALSSRRDQQTDTNGTIQETRESERLTEAGLSINYIVTSAWRDDIPDRLGFLQAQYKVFDTRSFVGAGYGGLELRGSRLEGSMVTVSYLRRLYSDSIRTAGGTLAKIENRDYGFLEFYIRVPGVQFLDRLRVKGGILLPLSGDQERTQYRVTLSVPITDLARF